MEQGNKIDLKKRVTDKSMQEMDGFVSFTTHMLNEKNLDELASISELLDKVGISLEINSLLLLKTWSIWFAIFPPTALGLDLALVPVTCL